MNSWAAAARAAASTSASLASGRAWAMLARRVSSNRNGSWVTRAMWSRSEAIPTSRTSTPSMATRPAVTS